MHDQQLTGGVDAVAIAIELLGLGRHPAGMEMGGGEPGMLPAQADQPAVQRQQRLTGGIVAELPLQGPGPHPVAARLRQIALLAKLLAVVQHHGAAGGEQGNQVGLGAVPVLAALHPRPIAADLVHQGAVVVVLDIDHGPAALSKIAAGIEGAQIGGAQLAAATGCKGLEQQRIKPGAAGADAVDLINRLIAIVGEILEQQQKVGAAAGLQAATQIGDQGGDARIPFAAAEEAPHVIEADAIDAEAIDPVPADIQDEFPGAAVVEVEVLEESTAFKLSNEGAIVPILI